MNSRQDLMHAFDQLRSGENGIPVDTATVIKRTFDERYELVVRIETGIAAGCEATLLSDDYPGTSAERVLFWTRAVAGKKISLKLRTINVMLIRANGIAIL